MKTFSTVEDYLEVIAGKRELDGNLPKQSSMWFSFGHEFKPILNLARYDVNFLDSVTNSTLDNKPLTDRQAELAVKLVLKYQKQLNARGIDVFVAGAEKYRIPLRMVDRKKSIEINNGEIYIRFPYDQRTIEFIRENTKASQGRVRFDREAKVWKAALTEYNVNWINAFGEAHGFERDTAFTDAMNMILQSETQVYKIELVYEDNYLTITNAPKGLLEHLGNEDNRFDRSEVQRLVDLSTVLGYIVSDEVMQDCTNDLGSDMAVMISRKDYDFKTYNWPHLEESIYKYAQLTNRFPIVVFDPQCAFERWNELVHGEDLLVLTHTKPKDEVQVCQNITAKVVLTNRAIKHLDRIPLLVSHMGMVVGQDKRIMLDASEKVFYRNGKLAW